MKKIGIIGGGVWGSALAKLLGSEKVQIYIRDKKIADSINNFKLNPKLKYATFSDNVRATTILKDLENVDYLILALPAQNIKGVLSDFNISNKNQNIIIASKGIDIDSVKFLSEVVYESTKSNNISILSGPCFSHEVAQNLPTAVTLATENKTTFESIAKLFQDKNFRLYYSDDLIGCQLGGAIKNIYAIAVGITAGLNLGENAKSSLITRSFAEMTRLGKELKIKKETLFGLSGLGDLILTCNSLKSRNANFGYLISSRPQVTIEDHLKSQETTEGYYTVVALKKIADKEKIAMPIMEAIYNILHGNASISEQIQKLLDRPETNEFY